MIKVGNEIRSYTKILREFLEICSNSTVRDFSIYLKNLKEIK